MAKKHFILVEFQSGALRSTSRGGVFPGSFLFPIRCASPDLPTETADRAQLKSPNLSHESSNRPVPDSHDEWEDQRDRCGGVRGFVRRLLHLLRPEETEWPELQEQAAGTWVLTSSSAPPPHFQHLMLRPGLTSYPEFKRPPRESALGPPAWKLLSLLIPKGTNAVHRIAWIRQ